MKRRSWRSLRSNGDPIPDIKKRYRHLKRYEQITRVLVRYGFGDVVKRFGRLNPLNKRIVETLYRGEAVSKPMRIRFVLQDLGPTAVKFGQWMSQRPDILSLEYLAELEKLQDRVPPFSFYQVREIIRKELGGEIDELFDYFSPTVIASGSIAQVHKARLKTGEDVAVKVQRPGIDKIIDTDMEILIELAGLAGEHIIDSELYDPVAMVEEFSFALEKQLDLQAEAKNIQRFRRNFEGVESVFAPAVFEEQTTKRILTIEYMEGIKITNAQEIVNAGLDNKLIASNLANAYLKQIYIDGFFHGDPHPGNFFVLPENVIGFTDFGIMGMLDDRAKKYLTQSLMAVIKKNSRDLAESMFEMGMVMDKTDFDGFAFDLDFMLEKYYGTSLQKINFGEVLADVMNVMNRHKIRMPPNLALLTVTLWSLESLLRSIDPDFNSFEASKPFVNDLISERMNPIARLKSAGESVVEYYEFMDELPKRMNRIMTKVEKGELRIIFRDERLERLNEVIDKASNRLIIGAIISTIVMGSSIVILSGRDPRIYGIPIVEASFIAAGLLGLWLIISIMRAGEY